MSKKNVLLIGASGTIGQAIIRELERDCNIIRVGNTSGDFQVNIESSESITNLYKQVKDIDAVICAAARNVVFAPLSEITKENFTTSLQSKFLGQIDLVLQGLKFLKDDTSFTLTTGILNSDPIAQGSAAAAVNGAVDAFIKAAAIDMPKKQRINSVSPTLLIESKEKYQDFFQGYKPVAAEDVALAYRKSVMGKITGQILKVGW